MIIREIELFEGFSEDMEGELGEVFETVSFQPGDVLFKQGDPAEDFYILHTGAVDVKIAGARQTTHVADKPGEAVGWSSLAGRETYSASVECTEPSTLIRINKDMLDQVLRRHPSTGLIFYKRLARLVGERLIESYRELVKLREKDDRVIP